MEERGKAMKRYCLGKRSVGLILVLAGVLLVFVCLPMEFLLIALGVAMAASGVILIYG